MKRLASAGLTSVLAGLLAGAGFAATLALASQASAAGDTLAKIREKGEFVYGADVQGGEPYVFEDPKDPAHHVIGFEVDVAAAIGKRLGVRARFLQADWPNLVPSLERGDFDVAMNGLEDTPSRRDRILLSIPYFVFGETLAVQRGKPEKSLADLRGRRVATLSQSYGSDVLTAQGFTPVLYDGVSEPYADLALGRVDGVLLDHIIADRYGCSRPDITCLPGDVARGTYVIGVRRDDASLKTALDGALADLLRKGELRAILERWKLWDSRQLGLSEPPGSALPGASAALPPDVILEGELHGPEASPTSPSVAPRAHWNVAQVRLFLEGAVVTLAISLAAFALALPIGLGLALARLEKTRLLRFSAAVYVEVFRGTPLLLQLYVLYYGLAPVVRLGPVTAAVLGLALNYAAYEAELHRGAILAVPRGQSEAARSLGLDRVQTLRYVLLPQSFRIALPAMTNDFVALLKDSSLVSVLTVVELTKRMTIAAIDFRSWVGPGVACAALYFAMSYPLARLARKLEKRLHKERHDAHA